MQGTTPARAIRRLCVFCGSASGFRPEYAAAARELGMLLAQQQIGIVYGGGSVGLMGELANAALAAGGEVIGVIPEVLMRREVAHTTVTELRVVKTLFERKAIMAELSDGFLVLPGGLGTLDELSEFATWTQLGLHQKPLVLINTCGFFDDLLQFLKHAVTEGFIPEEHAAIVQVVDSPAAALDLVLYGALPEIVPRWAVNEQRH